MHRLGLALSGGGFRATLYHLGVVRFLRDAGILPKITHITSVSGGSILGAHLVLNWERYSGSPDDFERLVDFRYREALLTARINSQSTRDQVQVIRFVRNYLKQFRPIRLTIKTIVPSNPTTKKRPKTTDSPFTFPEITKQKTTSQPTTKKHAKTTDSPFTFSEANTGATKTTRRH